MGILSRKKQAVGRGWDAAKRQREDEARPQAGQEKKEINDEEHQKRMNLLADIGLIKKSEVGKKEG
jgi:hypothetical protein